MLPLSTLVRDAPGGDMPYHHGRLREALLERAAEVIADGGVDALSLRGLARDLGVSHAAPRRHFEDRDSLLHALAQEAFRRSVEAMDAGAEREGSDPVARYRALGRSYVAFAQAEPAFFRVMHHPGMSGVLDGDLQAAQDAWFSRLREGAVAAQAAGWHPESDPEELVAFSVAAALGAAMLFSQDRWRRQLDLEDDARADAVADAVLALTVARTDVGGASISTDTGSEAAASASDHTTDTRRAS